MKFKFHHCWLLLLPVLLLASCSTPDGGPIALKIYEASMATADLLLKEGKIDMETYRAMLAAAKAAFDAAASPGASWVDVATEIGKVGVGIVCSLTGVRLWRGGITARKGSTE